jgi:hypothetical protein
MPFPSLTRHLLGLATVVLTAGFFATSAQAGVIVQAPKYVGLDKGLVGWWPFDGKSVAGNHAYDASGNGNRGTLSTTAIPPTAACPRGTDTYSTAGTFSWPSSWSGIEGCTSVNIQAWGGGGAYSAGAVSVTNGTSYTVIVGVGGTTADAAGGDNSFNDTSTILAREDLAPTPQPVDPAGRHLQVWAPRERAAARAARGARVRRELGATVAITE